MRIVEIILAYIGGITCVVVPIIFAAQERSLSPPGSNFWSELFPAPGIYFLEIALIGLATTNFITTNRTSQPTRWNGLPWISAGILLAFVILGILTIGLFLIPAMLSFLAAGILEDRRQEGNWPTHVMLFFLAAMVQAVAFYLILFVEAR